MKTTDLILSYNTNNISIRNRSQHYFFLIKENQLFIYNFYSWRLIIKQQDIWVLINRRILGLIPNWIINLNQEITSYRIVHPWKYRGIKLSIITLMKLIGLGFLLPYYGVVKGIYFFSKLRSLDLLTGEFTWKKIFFLASAGVSGVLLYNNFFCIVAQCYEGEKFDIVKSQSNLGSNSEKLIKSKYNWASSEYKIKASMENNNINPEYKRKSYLENIQERWISSKMTDLEYIKIKLAATEEKLVNTNIELLEKKVDLEDIQLDWEKIEIELASTKFKLAVTEEKLVNTKEELLCTKVDLEDIQLDWEKTEVELEETKKIVVSSKKELEQTKEILELTESNWKEAEAELKETNLDLQKAEVKLEETKSAWEKAKLVWEKVKLNWVSTKLELEQTNSDLENQTKIQDETIKQQRELIQKQQARIELQNEIIKKQGDVKK
jgi:hypothetical protein